jgi:transcriptional regulator with XRE-family HTH domain
MNKNNNKNRISAFSKELRRYLSKAKLTYEKFAEKSGVSKSYLTEILVHHRIPSKDIIERISNALDIKPDVFREYRILKAVENIGIYYASFKLKDIEELEKFIEKIKNRTKGKDIEILNKGMVYNTEFEPEFLINISDLMPHQIDILKTVARKFREENRKEIEEIYGDIVLSNRE